MRQGADAIRTEPATDRPAIEALIEDLDAVAGGDSAALRRLYDATSAKLFGVCIHILQDRELAEDALQDVYLKIWYRAGRYDRDRASPITWLTVIARNTALDRRRGAQRAPSGSDEWLGALSDPAKIADSMIEERQEHERLFGCMEELTRDENAAITAAFMEGYTYSEVAERKSVPLGTMKSWVRRGLARLRKCLGDG